MFRKNLNKNGVYQRWYYSYLYQKLEENISQVNTLQRKMWVNSFILLREAIINSWIENRQTKIIFCNHITHLLSKGSNLYKLASQINKITDWFSRFTTLDKGLVYSTGESGHVWTGHHILSASFSCMHSKSF